MLKQFSRLEKTRSLVIIIFALLMGLSLVFFYAPGARDAAGSTTGMSREVLAKVRGEKIMVADIDMLVNEYRRQSGMATLSPMQLGGSARLLDELIKKRIVKQEVERLGLAPSDAEVADAIRRANSDPATNRFIGYDRYKDQVVAQFGSIEAYEQNVRERLSTQKLYAFITAGVSVSEDDIQREWERDNTRFNLIYVPVTGTELAKTVKPTDEEIAAYYNEHQQDFYISDPQKKIRYLFISQTKMGEKLQIPDKELQDVFNGWTEEQKTAGFEIQQIVLKVPSQGDYQRIQEKASQLVASVRDDKTMKADEAKFAELARGNSQDTATKDKGGWLPNPVKKDPNRKDIYQNVFGDQPMQEGEVKDPLYDAKASAFYILRRGKAVPKTFETAKPEIIASLRNNKAYTAAAALAARAAERLKETKDFDAVAREFASEANMSAAEMVKTTDFIKPKDTVPDIGSNPQFEEAIAPLNEPQQVGERTPIPNGFAIPMLLEKRDPRTPALEEVREKVAERVKEQKADAQVEQAARELAAANTPDELRAAAQRLGLKVEESNDYKLKSPLGTVGTSPEADDAIYALSAGQVTKTPVKTSGAWLVAAATDREAADPAEYAEQRDQLVDTALDQAREQVFDDYTAGVRARLERGGDIKVYDDVLAKVTALEKPPAASPRSRGSVPVETDDE